VSGSISHPHTWGFLAKHPLIRFSPLIYQLYHLLRQLPLTSHPAFDMPLIRLLFHPLLKMGLLIRSLKPLMDHPLDPPTLTRYFKITPVSLPLPPVGIQAREGHPWVRILPTVHQNPQNPPMPIIPRTSPTCTRCLPTTFITRYAPILIQGPVTLSGMAIDLSLTPSNLDPPPAMHSHTIPVVAILRSILLHILMGRDPPCSRPMALRYTRLLRGHTVTAPALMNRMAKTDCTILTFFLAPLANVPDGGLMRWSDFMTVTIRVALKLMGP